MYLDAYYRSHIHQGGEMKMKIASNDRAEGDMTGKVIGIGIALFVTAIVLPLGLNALANASMPNVNSSVKTMLIVLLPVLGVVGIALLFYRHSND